MVLVRFPFCYAGYFAFPKSSLDQLPGAGFVFCIQANGSNGGGFNVEYDVMFHDGGGFYRFFMWRLAYSLSEVL